MADNARLTYQLSQTASTVWQQGGAAAVALQHQLAELHRQGSLGLHPIMEVVHPDGILAARHEVLSQTQGEALSPHGQAPVWEQGQERARGQTQEPMRDLGRAEGTLIETSTVTAYQMSTRESAAWSRGDHEARMVEANIGDALKDVTTSQPVAVLLDDGRTAYTAGGSLVQSLSEGLRLLRDQLSALTSGVQVHMDFSVQLGRPQGATHEAIATLQQRADQLTRPAPQRARDQGMNY